MRLLLALLIAGCSGAPIAEPEPVKPWIIDTMSNEERHVAAWESAVSRWSTAGGIAIEYELGQCEPMTRRCLAAQETIEDTTGQGHIMYGAADRDNWAVISSKYSAEISAREAAHEMGHALGSGHTDGSLMIGGHVIDGQNHLEFNRIGEAELEALCEVQECTAFIPEGT